MILQKLSNIAVTFDQFDVSLLKKIWMVACKLIIDKICKITEVFFTHLEHDFKRADLQKKIDWASFE